MARIACFGEILLRLSPANGVGLRRASQLDLHVGGAEANVAVGLAQLGHDVRMISAVPANPLGERMRRALDAERVDTRFMVDGRGRAGLYFVDGLGAGRTPRVTYDRAESAFARCGTEAFDLAAALDGIDLLVVSGISPALGAEPAAATLAIVNAARYAECTVAMDCNYRESLWRGSDRERASVLAPIVEQVDVLFASHRDAAYLAGFEGGAREEREAASALFARFPRLSAIIATRRGEGADIAGTVAARLDRPDGDTKSGPVNLPSQVGRIGAGDAFAAGVLHGLMEGWEDSRVLDLGLAALALKHATPGDMPDHSQADLADHTPGGIRR
ncbi:sugar kinase [Alteriqipengyuania sp.]|uniref:sugar kinase n=1 Tax=Alteriqipengyuania sp. TaxID=2800692 RepID=UPI0035137B17